LHVCPSMCRRPGTLTGMHAANVSANAVTKVARCRALFMRKEYSRRPGLRSNLERLRCASGGLPAPVLDGVHALVCDLEEVARVVGVAGVGGRSDVDAQPQPLDDHVRDGGLEPGDERAHSLRRGVGEECDELVTAPPRYDVAGTSGVR